ncbi:Scramblase-domain-containing protein [Russula earlei]|uniref:Scramblase-domain-containing protein n=1 Tax=Russula earlei TaxID=71964 RepID=A0ACC0UHA8_9AGAM|nr:Scramblase-domain-containing protein [Russula earlei]
MSILTLSRLGVLAGTVRYQRALVWRSFALSRFPDRGAPSGGRTRPGTPTPRNRPTLGNHPHSQPSPAQDESAFGTSHSPLWEEGQRRPASNPEDGLKRLLQNDTLVVTRQLEMLNIFVGFEQTNKYVISNECGETIGFMAEEPRGLLASFSRQILKTHRPFRALVMDREGTPVLWVRRPFAWINSRMYVQSLKDWHEYTSTGEPILDTFAEAQQRWHLWRRRYDLFIRAAPGHILSKASELQPEPEPEPESAHFAQFAKIDEGFWAWHFTLRGSRGEELASISRAFRGFGREIFTDTGKSPTSLERRGDLSQDNAPREPTVIRELSLQERALVLAMAVNVDFDYFSRHSQAGPGFGIWHFGWSSSD